MEEISFHRWSGHWFSSPIELTKKKQKNMILVLQGSLPAGPAQVPRASGKAKQ
jgi:hypothetical protein